MKPRPQALVYGCLILSGSTSLIYELLWTRILSFSFGSTSLAFAAVLAVFFLGLAGGSMLGGRAARRLADPLRAYGWLELAIGAYAGIAFPFLFKLHHLFSLHNAGGAEPSGLAFRFLASALVLALPTLCMGATFPILLEHLRRERSHLTEALGRLYGINTLGAFLGVYAATHWLIPVLGLDKANYTAVALNTLVFLLVFALGGKAVAAEGIPAQDGAPDAAASASPGQAIADFNPRLATVGLLLLAASGFTTLIYEVVWGRVLTISLEGSLYGFGTTLGSFLAGIALGGMAFSFAARRLQRAETLFRAYVIVCVAVIAYLALSRLLLPVEGYLIKSVNQSMRGLLGLHVGFGLGVLFLLPLTTGLGFMFPAAVALYNHGRANPAEGAGRAYALNTAMSVLGSLASASFLMNKLGIEGIVFLGALVMLGTLLAAVLLAEAGKPGRRIWLVLAAVPLVAVAGWWPAIDAKTVLIGAYDGKPPSLHQLFQNLSLQFSPTNPIKVYKDGVGTTLTVTAAGRSVGLQSNGLPQSGREMDPPHFNLESSLVGLFPAMHKPDAKDALVIGLGAGISVGVLRMAGIPHVEVVELEPAMAALCRGIYPKGESPLDDTGVTLRLDDARNFLVRNAYREHPRRWDLIASQPAHPWVSGAADLFTEEMFRLAYANLSEGGVFCQWFMPSGVDAGIYTALSNAFARVFDQVLVYRSFGAQQGLYFIGTRGRPGLSLGAMEELFDRPGLRQLLDLHQHRRPALAFRYAATSLADGKDLVAPGRPVNRDRNAFVESRMPLLPMSAQLPMAPMRDGSFTGPLPSAFLQPGARESLFVFDAIDELSGNLPSPRKSQEPDSVRMDRIAVFRANSPSPFKEYYALHLALAAEGSPEGSALEAVSRNARKLAAVEAAAGRARAAGQALLEAQIRLLGLRLASPAAGAWAYVPPESLPAYFRRTYYSRLVQASAEAAARSAAGASAKAAFQGVDSLARIHAVNLDTAVLRLALLLEAHALKDTAVLSPARAPLGEQSLQLLYRQCLLDWAHEDIYLEALQWYCAATGHGDRSAMVSRQREDFQRKRQNRMMAEGMRLKLAKRHPEALAVFREALRMNPALQTPYLAQAEIFGLERNRPAFDSLVMDINRVFPQPDVSLQRVKEAYELKPEALAPSDSSGN